MIDVTDSLYDTVLRIARARVASRRSPESAEDLAHEMWSRLLERWRENEPVNPREHLPLIRLAITGLIVDAFRREETAADALERMVTTSTSLRTGSRAEWVNALDAAVVAVQSFVDGQGLGVHVKKENRERLKRVLELKASPMDLNREQIAAQLGVSTGTISNDLKALQRIIISAWSP